MLFITKFHYLFKSLQSVKKNKLDFVQTINNHRKMLSLPIHSNLKEKDIKYCCTIIKKFFS